MIEIKNLRKEFKNVTPLKDVNVTINDGDVISVIGPSGTGKSTLIRCINLLEKPTSGQIIFNGEDITVRGFNAKKVRQKMGMVFQSFNLFGHLTVIENLMLAPMDLLKKNRQDAYDTGMEYLRRVGLPEKALSYPDELSGGQKQRVAIARTLCMDPEVILLDEPTSALDPTMVSEVQAVIRDLSRSGKTMMIVTHEMNFAHAISNRVFFMDDGGICEDGTPEEIFDHPEKELTRRFIRQLKIFEAAIEGRNFDYALFVSELDRYLQANGVPSPDKYRIRLALEETLQQMLFSHYEEPQARIVVEYSMRDGRASIVIKYAGERFDILGGGNELSLKLLKNTASDIRYGFNEGDGFANRIDIDIR